MSSPFTITYPKFPHNELMDALVWLREAARTQVLPAGTPIPLVEVKVIERLLTAAIAEAEVLEQQRPTLVRKTCDMTEPGWKPLP